MSSVLTNNRRESRHMRIEGAPPSYTEERFSIFFSQFGRIQKISIKEGGQVIVSFMDVRSAQKAYSANPKIDGRHLKLFFHEPGASNAVYGNTTKDSEIENNEISNVKRQLPTLSNSLGIKIEQRILLSDKKEKKRNCNFEKSENKELLEKSNNSTFATKKIYEKSLEKVKNDEYIKLCHTQACSSNVRKNEDQAKQANGGLLGISVEKLSSSYNNDKLQDYFKKVVKKHANLIDIQFNKEYSSNNLIILLQKVVDINSLLIELNQNDNNKPQIKAVLADSATVTEAHNNYLAATTAVASGIGLSKPSINTKDDNLLPKNILKSKEKKNNCLTESQNGSELTATTTSLSAVLTTPIISKSFVSSSLYGISSVNADPFYKNASRTLYVGNLERRVTDDSLKERFDVFGHILDIDVKNRDTAPFAFIQYTNINSVVAAIKACNPNKSFSSSQNNSDKTVASITNSLKPLKTNWGKSICSNKLWIGALPASCSEQYLVSKMKIIAPDDIIEVIYDAKFHEAIVVFKFTESAQIACNKIKNKILTFPPEKQHKGNSLHVHVDFCSEKLHDFFVDRKFGQFNDTDCAIAIVENDESKTDETNVLIDQPKTSNFKNSTTAVPSPPLSAADVAAAATAAAEKIKKMFTSVDSLYSKAPKMLDNSLILNPPPDPPKSLRTADTTNRHHNLSPSQTNNENNNGIPPDPAMSFSDKMRHNVSGMSTSNRKSMPDLSSKNNRNSYNYSKNDKSSATRDKDRERRSSSRSYNSFNSLKRRNEHNENHSSFSKNYHYSNSYHNFENYQITNAQNRHENSFLSSSSTSLSSGASGSLENSSASYDSDHEKRYKHYSDRKKNLSKHSWHRSKKGKTFVKNYGQSDKRDTNNSNFLSPSDSSKRVFDISSSSISSGNHEKKSSDRNRASEKKDSLKSRRINTDDFCDKNVRKSISPRCIPSSNSSLKKLNNLVEDGFHKNNQSSRIRNCSSSSTSSAVSNSSNILVKNASKLPSNEQKNNLVNKAVTDSVAIKEPLKNTLITNKGFKPSFSKVLSDFDSSATNINSTAINELKSTTSIDSTIKTTLTALTSVQPRTSLEMRLFDLYGGHNTSGTIVAKSLSTVSTQKSSFSDNNTTKKKNSLNLHSNNCNNDNSDQQIYNKNKETKKIVLQSHLTTEKSNKKALSNQRAIKVLTTIPLNAATHTLNIEGLIDPRIKKHSLNKSSVNFNDVYLMLPKFSINYLTKNETKECSQAKHCYKNNLQDKTHTFSQSQQQRPSIASLNDSITQHEDENLNDLALHETNLGFNHENSVLLKLKNNNGNQTIANCDLNFSDLNENNLSKSETKKQIDLISEELCNPKKNKITKNEDKNELVTDLFQAFCSLQTTKKISTIAKRLTDLKTKLNEAQDCIDQIKTENNISTCRHLSIREELERLQAKQNKADELAGSTNNEHLIHKLNYNRIVSKKNCQLPVSLHITSTYNSSLFALSSSTNSNITTNTLTTSETTKSINLISDLNRKVENDNRKTLKDILPVKKDSKENERLNTLQLQKRKINSKTIIFDSKIQTIQSNVNNKANLEGNFTNFIEKTSVNDCVKSETINLINLKNETDTLSKSIVATQKTDTINVSALPSKNYVSHVSSFKDNKNRRILDDLFRQQANDTKRISSSNLKEDKRKYDLPTSGLLNTKTNSSATISQLVNDTNAKTKIKLEKKDVKDQAKKAEEINTQKNQMFQLIDLNAKPKLSEQETKTNLTKILSFTTKERCVVKDEKQVNSSLPKLNVSSNVVKTIKDKEKRDNALKLPFDKEITDYKKEDKKKNILITNKDVTRPIKSKKETSKNKLLIDSKKDDNKKGKDKRKKQKIIYTSSNSSNDESGSDNEEILLSNFGLKGIDVEEQRRLMEEIKSGTYGMSMYDRVKRRSSALKPCEEKKKAEALEKLKQKSKKKFSRVKLSLSSESSSSDNDTTQCRKKPKNIKRISESDDNFNKPSTSFQNEYLQKTLSTSKLLTNEKLNKIKQNDNKLLSDKELKSNKLYNSSGKSSNNNSDIDLYESKKSDNDLNNESVCKKKNLLKKFKNYDSKEELYFENRKQLINQLDLEKVAEDVSSTQKNFKNRILSKKIENLQIKPKKKLIATKISTSSYTTHSNSDKSSNEISDSSKSNATSTDGESYVKNLRKELSKCHSVTDSDTDVSLWKKKERSQSLTKDSDDSELKNNKISNSSLKRLFPKKIQQLSMDDVFDSNSSADESSPTNNLNFFAEETTYLNLKKTTQLKYEKLESENLEKIINKEKIDDKKKILTLESISDKEVKQSKKNIELLKKNQKRKCNFSEREDGKNNLKLFKKRKIDNKSENKSKLKKRIAINSKDVKNVRTIKKFKKSFDETKNEIDCLKTKFNEEDDEKIEITVTNSFDNNDNSFSKVLSTSLSNNEEDKNQEMTNNKLISKTVFNLDTCTNVNVDEKEKQIDFMLDKQISSNTLEKNLLTEEEKNSKKNIVEQVPLSNSSESSSSSSDEEENKCSSSLFYNAASAESKRRQLLKQQQKSCLFKSPKYLTCADEQLHSDNLLIQKDNKIQDFLESNEVNKLTVNLKMEKDVFSSISDEKLLSKNLLSHSLLSNSDVFEKDTQNLTSDLYKSTINKNCEVKVSGTAKSSFNEINKSSEKEHSLNQKNLSGFVKSSNLCSTSIVCNDDTNIQKNFHKNSSKVTQEKDNTKNLRQNLTNNKLKKKNSFFNSIKNEKSLKKLLEREIEDEENDELTEAELLRRMREEEEAAVLNLTDFGCFESATSNSFATEKALSNIDKDKTDKQNQVVENSNKNTFVDQKKTVENVLNKTYNQKEADDAVSSITAIAFELLEEEEKKRAELEKSLKVNEISQNNKASNFNTEEKKYQNVQCKAIEQKDELVKLEQKIILDEIANEQINECQDNVGGGYMEIDAEHLLRQQKEEEEKRALERRRVEELAKMEESLETIATASINPLIVEPSFTKSGVNLQQQSQPNHQYLPYQIPLQQTTQKLVVTTTASTNSAYSVGNQSSFIQQQQIANFQHSGIHTPQSVEQQQNLSSRQQQLPLQSNQNHQVIVDSQMQINNQSVGQQIPQNLIHSALKKHVAVHDQNYVQRNVVANVNTSYPFEQPQNFNQNVQMAARNVTGTAMLPQCKNVNMMNQIVGSTNNYQRTQPTNHQPISIQNQQNSHHRYVQIHPQYNSTTFTNKSNSVKVQQTQQQSQQQNPMHLNYQQSIAMPINPQNYYPQQLQHTNLSNSQQGQTFISSEQSQDIFINQQLSSAISQQPQNQQINSNHLQQAKTSQQIPSYQQHQSTQLLNTVTQQQFTNVNQNRVVSDKNILMTSTPQQTNTAVNVTTPKPQSSATSSLTTSNISQQQTYYQQQQVSRIQSQNFGSSQQQTNVYQQQIEQRIQQEQKKLDQEKIEEQQRLQQLQQLEQQRLHQQHEQQRFQQQQLELQKLQQQQLEQQQLEKQKLEQKRFQQQIEQRKLQQQKLEKQRIEQTEKVRLDQLQQHKDQKLLVSSGPQLNALHKHNQQHIQFNQNQSTQQKPNANHIDQQKLNTASSQFAHLLQQQNILQNLSREQISAMLSTSMPQIKTETLNEIKNSLSRSNQQDQTKLTQNQNSYVKQQQLQQKNTYSQQIPRPQSVMPPTQIEKQVQQSNQSTQLQRPLSNLAAASNINVPQQSYSTDFSADHSTMNAQLLALYNRFNLINNPLMQQNAAAALYARSMTPNISLLTKNLTSTQQQSTCNPLTEESNFTNINSTTSLDLLRQHAAQQLQAIQQQALQSPNVANAELSVQQQFKLQTSRNQAAALEKQQKTSAGLSVTQSFQKQNALLQQQQKNSVSTTTQISQSQTLQRHAGDNYPVVWQGQLAMKTTETLVQLHRVCGNDRFIEITNQELVTRLNNVNTIRITQRMRLEPSQLESLTKKMEKNENFVSLLCLPCGRNREIIESHTEKMRKNFIEYFTEKMAAGIINQGPVSNPSCVAHVFPPSQFASIHLNKHAPDLLSTLEKHGSCYLFVVITYV